MKIYEIEGLDNWDIVYSRKEEPKHSENEYLYITLKRRKRVDPSPSPVA